MFAFTPQQTSCVTLTSSRHIDTVAAKHRQSRKEQWYNVPHRTNMGSQMKTHGKRNDE
jgi:hypothetical protein